MSRPQSQFRKIPIAQFHFDLVLSRYVLLVIKTADWIVDLGPEGGSGGGEILVAGTPETVANCEASHTARFLKPLLKKK